MKIYVLLILIGVIVGFSYMPLRRSARPVSPAPADTITASV